MKWFIVYPGVVFFGAGLAVMVAPFYGLFRALRRSLWNRQRLQPAARRFPVQWPVLQSPASLPVSRSYGFVPVQRPVQSVFYGFVPGWRPVSASVHSLLLVAPRG